MKRILVGSAVAVLAVPAFAQEVKLPTIYGQVNKAIHYVSQKKEMNYSKMTNLVDVKNSESRLGAKGTHEINTLKVNYNLLVGLDSSYADGTGAGRVRIRNAEFSMSDFWGTVFGGQTADIASAASAKLDPLGTTFAGFSGYDQNETIKNATTSLGYLDRSRVDQIGYKTPEWMGLQYTVATSKIALSNSGDTTDKIVDDNTISPATASSTHPATRVSNLLTYNHKFNDMFKMEAFAGYNILKTGYFKTYNDYLGALSFTYGEFTLSGEYTKLNRQINSASFKMKNTMINASLKWVHGDHTVAATFANRTNEDAAKTSTTGSRNGEYNQIAAGYMYSLNKYVQLRGVYAHYTTDTENTSKNTSSTDSTPFKNSADVVSLGTLVTF